MKDPDLEPRGWRARLSAPKDIASLALFRILLGFVMSAGLLRFVLQGWVEKIYERPSFFFKFPGFEWVFVPGPTGLYLLFGITWLAAVLVTIGLYYRVAIITFFLGFTYIQLMEVTSYLNHYYLVVLLAGLLVFMPAHGAFSLDVLRRPELARSRVPAWMVYVLRLQLGLVYFYAALAKLQPDWLLHAEPLRTWLYARSETPLVGPLFVWAPTAYSMSWAGFLYDLTIPAWLSWRRSRPFAYLVVLVFHAYTFVLFDIGMFPFIMTVCTTIFFDPSWPRRFARSTGGASLKPPSLVGPGKASPLRPALSLLLAGYVCIQALLPARHWLYPGDVLWSEEGMRFAWKVMVREKNGAITYHVTQKDSGRSWQIDPLAYLEWRQYSDMSGQPDLIVQLAKHIAWDLQQKGRGEVEVRAEAWVSLNGRAPRLLLDPSVDLSRVRDGFGPMAFVTAAPAEPPRDGRDLLSLRSPTP